MFRRPASRFAESPEMNRIVSNPRYCLETLSSIVDKDTHTVPFVFNASQARYYKRRTHRDIILKPRQLGFCCHPKTRILTADLKWVALKDIKKGQTIVAVDEFSGSRGKGRRLRTAHVLKKCIVWEEAFKLRTEDGRELIVTGEHKFLSKSSPAHKNSKTKLKCFEKDKGRSLRWQKVKDFRIGDEIRWLTKPWERGDFEDGWFGGLIDGEGSFGYKNKNHSVNLGVAQASGSLFGQMKSYAEKRNYSFTIDSDQREIRDGSPGQVVKRLSFSRLDELFQLIGQTRPKKHIGVNWWEGRELPGKRSGTGWSKIVGIELLGKREMIDLQTSEKTYIAEGFVSHNSTQVIGLFLHDTMYTSNTISVLVAQTDKDATDMFSRALYMYNSIPEGFKPTRHRENMRALVFDRINSTFFIGSAESKGFGRGKTINNLHCTELSLPVWQGTDLNGLLESVPRNGRVVLESTARGEGGVYYDMYFDAKHGLNEFTPHFYRWWEHREYREPLPIGVSRKAFIDSYDYEERELVKTYNLVPEQMRWRQIKKARLRFLFGQEYPEWEDEDAFIKSGTSIFDATLLKERDDLLPEQAPSEMWLGGDLFLYRIARPGCKYIISVDTSEGDINSDFTAAMVNRVYPLPIEQAALLHGKWTPDIASEKVYKLARAYNNSIIAVERNNHGHAMLLNLGNGIVRNGVVAYPPWPHLYLGPDKKLGWLTTPLSKNQMVQELDRVMRSGELVINSKPFIKEARRFVTLKGGGYGVPKAVGNDDIVMAQAIGVMAATMGKFDFDFI